MFRIHRQFPVLLSRVGGVITSPDPTRLSKTVLYSRVRRCDHSTDSTQQNSFVESRRIGWSRLYSCSIRWVMSGPVPCWQTRQSSNKKYLSQYSRPQSHMCGALVTHIGTVAKWWWHCGIHSGRIGIAYNKEAWKCLTTSQLYQRLSTRKKYFKHTFFKVACVCGGP